MAIPLGLARKEKGVAAFSGFVGYVIMNLTINFYLQETGRLADPENLREAGQGMVFGIQTIEMGVLGGIIAGLVVYQLHKRFYTIQLSDSFAFFSGVRFVPIITSLVMPIIGLLIPVIWPIFALVITTIGLAIQKAGAFGPFLFGSGERLLLPFGLHHILVSMIRFTEAGGSAIINGNEVFGALNIFYAELQNNLPISPSATAFLSQGKMPTFMFGLPVEFLFLFVSPFLWIFHVIMTGLGFMVMSLLGVTIGNTDGGVLDFLIFGIMQGNYTKWWLVLIVGAFWFAIYYFVFKFVIVRKNLATPGREEVIDTTEYSNEEVNYSKKGSFDATGILAALGGTENIESLDNCITRLRLVLKDGALVNDARLKELGALGVVHLDDKNVQVIIGTKVTTVRNALDALL
jgi:PTS system maltose and glucose-specific IIC component